MFDPLHKWLGIPPEEQPPNHYRLLGIAAFEGDTEVIDAAADKQLAFLHDLTNGDHGEKAEQLSNQVSAARLCLLNDGKKETYDATLRGQLERSLPLPSAQPSDLLTPSSGPSTNPVTGEPYIPAPSASTPVEPEYRVTPETSSSTTEVSTASSRRTQNRPRKSHRKYLHLSTLLCLVVLTLVGVGVYQGRLVFDFSLLESLGLASPQPSPAPSTSTIPAPSPGSPIATSEPTAPSPITKPTPSSSVNVKRPEDASTTPGRPNPQSTTSLTPPPRPTKPRSLGDLLHSGASSSETAPVIMEPLPSESQIEIKMDLIRELYQEEYRDAQTPEKRLELAQLMHREGQNTNDDAVGRFALWKVARDIMVREGEFASALAIADNMQTHYHDVDALQLKTQVLEDAAMRITPGTLPKFIESASEVTHDCLRQERFGLARVFTDFLKQDLETKATGIQIAKIDQLQREVQASELSFKEYELAFITLEKTVDDPQANLAAGRFLCFIRGDWDTGLNHLSQASDPKISSAAEMELGASFDSPNATEVADAWFDIAESETGEHEQANIRRHALEWYREVIDGTSGLQERKVQSRITTLERLLPGDDRPNGSSSEKLPNAIRYRVHTSKDSRSDFVERKGDTFTMGMGSRPDGRGEAIAGIELENVSKITVLGSASQNIDVAIDNYSKTGFMVDYHTPGGYTKRVFLGLGLKPNREFTTAPSEWGTKTKPEFVTDIGRENTYKIDLSRWAPSTWDGRCWFTIYMQNAGPNRTVSAKVSWEAN
ncbi:MAG: hypothetical protein ACR2NZ_13740 [Rubripirellula sp.]